MTATPRRPRHPHRQGRGKARPVADQPRLPEHRRRRGSRSRQPEHGEATHWRHVAFPSQPGAAAEPAWQYLPHWLAAAFLLRLLVAVSGDFAIHPDEIMQYLEPAHGLVFGNAVVQWEFFYGARSWLIPLLMAGLLWLCKVLGLGEPWFYIDFVKAVLCAFSLLIPWGLYQFSRHRLDEKVARLVLVLTCLWPFLVGYAHKPLSEFVATNLLCLALALAVMPRAHHVGRAFITGFLLAMVAAMRIQYAPAALLVWIFFVMAVPARTAVAVVLGSIGAAALTMTVEYKFWGHLPVQLGIVGHLFHSYLTNIAFNFTLDQVREPMPAGFYFGRLLYMTACGILPAIWFMFKRARRHVLVGAVVLVTFVFHQIMPHKEMRFLFLAVVLCFIPLADWLASLKSLRKGAALRTTTTTCAVLCLLFLPNLVPFNSWFHEGNSGERDDYNFIFRQTSVWDMYRELAASPDTKGVLHAGEALFQLPGYYYLHRKVPYYSLYTIGETAKNHGMDDYRQLISHIIMPKWAYEAEDMPRGFAVQREEDDYVILRNLGLEGEVPGWVDYRTHVVPDVLITLATRAVGNDRAGPLNRLVGYVDTEASDAPTR